MAVYGNSSPTRQIDQIVASHAVVTYGNFGRIVTTACALPVVIIKHHCRTIKACDVVAAYGCSYRPIDDIYSMLATVV